MKVGSCDDAIDAIAIQENLFRTPRRIDAGLQGEHTHAILIDNVI